MHYLRRTMALAMAFVLVTPAVAFASHYRYGSNSWQPGTTSNSIDFQVSEAWRRSAFFGSGTDGRPVPGDVVMSHSTMWFGDGTSTGFDLLITSVDPANDWMFGVGLDPARPAGNKTDTAIGHTYASPGTYTMFTEGCCRVGRTSVNYHVNNADEAQRVETKVNVGGVNRAPVSTLPPIVGCPVNGTCSFTVPASDADGDTLRYRFSTSAEAGSAGFQQPGPPWATNAATIDAATGLYTWNTTGATMGPVGSNTLYSTQVTIEDLDAGGAVKSKTAVDFLIQLGAVTGSPPVFDNPPTPTCNSTLEIGAGSPLSFTMQASDADAGSSVTLNVAGLPVGASMAPALPTTANPVSSAFSWTPAASQEGNHIVTFTATDNTGQQVLCSLTVAVKKGTNQPPSVNAGSDVSGSEGSAIALDATVSDPDDATVATAWSFSPATGVDAWATCTFADPAAVDTTITCSDDGVYTAILTGNDGKGDAVVDTAVVSVGNVAPDLGPLAGPVDAVAVNTATTVSGAFTDPGQNDTHTCAINWGDSSSSSGFVNTGTCSGNHNYTSPGVYAVAMTVTDDDSGSDTEMFQYVVVYDPSAGFVTGGGWIDSPAGAYTADPTLTGKANFGFVSKYKKGATVPDGSTQFQFHAGNLNFHSTVYEWLVVSGPKAQYKGSGTINGAGDYGFILTANDGQVAGGGGVDRFRIKIWDKASGTVIYDNQGAAADDAAASDEIEGGSIVIHAKK